MVDIADKNREEIKKELQSFDLSNFDGLRYFDHNGSHISVAFYEVILKQL